MLNGELLHIATSVAHKLAREAIWSEGMCSWAGLERRHEKGDVVATILGPTIYDGSAGIAYFLSDVYAIGGEQAVRRTAVGALTHALSLADDLVGKGNFGLYDGLAGVIFAATACGPACEREDLAHKAAGYVDHLAEAIPGMEISDIVSGLAGIVSVLLYLDADRPNGRFLDLAVKAGDRAITLAKQTTTTATWRSGRGGGPALAGYSHGAGGIGAALIGLFERTGEERFKEVALKAFAFERLTYDPSTGVWPDLRELRPPHSGDPRRQRTMFAWCHGAPGILLSRIYAGTVLQNSALMDDARVALGAVIDALPDMLAAEYPDTCACHGLASIAVILNMAAEAGIKSGLGAVAEGVAQTCVNLYARHGILPNGLSRFEDTPQFMIGSSGAAQCLLHFGGLSRLCWPLDIRFVGSNRRD
jgi:lantibiotic modifying enzyme